MQTGLKVAIAEFPPLIIDDKGAYSGFEIDLWEAIAKTAGFGFQYEKHAFKELIPLLAEKKADVALAGVTINEKREKVMDFSHPTLDSGLLIAVNKDANRANIMRSIRTLFTEGKKIIMPALLGVTAFMVIFGNLLWFVERNVHTFSGNYFPGIFESLWLVICSMSTDSFGDYVPHTWLGRIITVFIIIGGVAIFGLLIAQVTSFLAVKKIQGEINSSRDLNKKSVATLEGSTSEAILRKVGASAVLLPTIGEAFKALRDKRVNAVVFDAPAVLYYQEQNEEKIEIVGELFDKQKYAVALQQGSPLREAINLAILEIKETGQYDVLYRKWFGENPIMES